MEYFFALLMAYYTCDEAAKVTVLPRPVISQCGLIYDEMKGHFLPLVDMPKGEANVIAYTRFKQFEASSSETIALMREIARQSVAPLAESTQGARPDVF